MICKTALYYFWTSSFMPCHHRVLCPLLFWVLCLFIIWVLCLLMILGVMPILCFWVPCHSYGFVIVSLVFICDA
ncbi:MAG: hypothetical protein NXY57DRAFT_156754 [Lentinula lateritia]|nr:MAG: hypothetical protein NXY57DRAFT_156754 [Lentinula lateritia]